MVERCIERSRPFGVVLIRSGSEVGDGPVEVARIGTFAEIREAQRLPDGRYDLLAVGSGRFSIGAVDSAAEPYLVARVRPLDEELGDPARSTELGDRAMRRFIRYLQLFQPAEGGSIEGIDIQIEVETEGLGEDAGGGGGGAGVRPGTSDAGGARDLDDATRRLVIPDDPTTLSYLLAGIIQVEPPRRQALLEEVTTEERLAALNRLIDREIWFLERDLRGTGPDHSYDAIRRN
jgi:ATP-dependent Lon protease